MVKPGSRSHPGILFEAIVRYALRVAAARQHRFARMTKVPLRCLLDEPLVAYARTEYTEYHEMLETTFANSRPETRHCRGVRRCHLAPRGSGIRSRCSARAGGLPQPGRLACQTAPARPRAASDDCRLCLHEFKRIHRHCAAFPRHSALCLRQIERIAWTPISKDSSDLRRDHSTDRNRRSELLDLVWVSLTMEIAA